MTPTKALELAMAVKIGSDTGTLAEGTTFVSVHLAKASFTPSADSVVGDFTEADFNGYSAIHAASASTEVTIESNTGDYQVQVRVPAGGWHWVTGSSANLPQTIYGFYLTDAAGANVWGSELFEEAITLTSVYQGIDIDAVKYTVPTGVIS